MPCALKARPLVCARIFLLGCLQLALLGCSSTYYDALETLGVHKRDIFVDRIEESLEVQKEGQAQFESALEQFKATIDFDGGGGRSSQSASERQSRRAKSSGRLKLQSYLDRA